MNEYCMNEYCIHMYISICDYIFGGRQGKSWGFASIVFTEDVWMCRCMDILYCARQGKSSGFASIFFKIVASSLQVTVLFLHTFFFLRTQSDILVNMLRNSAQTILIPYLTCCCFLRVRSGFVQVNAIALSFAFNWENIMVDALSYQSRVARCFVIYQIIIAFILFFVLWI